MSARAQASRGYRLRPAPRSRKRGRPGSRVQWDRIGRVALVLVLFAILASYVNPVVNFIDAWSDSRSERASFNDLKQENAKLREQIANLSSPDAAERGARKLGMVAEGEGSYVIKGLRE
ncbi:MAG: FtsB family cell division protein [Solirubrobacterales bacterium]